MRDGGIGRRGALRRWVVLGGLTFCAAVAVVLLMAMALVEESPSWWRTIREDDPTTIEAARRLENGVVTELTHARPADPNAPAGDAVWRSGAWKVALRAPDANAWLSARLPRWLANYEEDIDWPEDLSQLQVEFDEDRIHVGVEVELGGEARVLSATLRPLVAPDGSIWMRAGTVRIGRLGLPATWVLRDSERIIQAYVPEELQSLDETEGMLSAFRGELPLVEDPVLDLEDGRRVRLLALSSRDGYLEITCRTEKE